MLILCHSDEMSERLIRIFLFCCFFNRIDWMKSLLNPVFLLKNMYLYYSYYLKISVMKKVNVLLAICVAVFSVYSWAYCSKSSTNSLFSLMDIVNIEALGTPETGTATCSISYGCINSSGQRDGEVKCTGTEKCHRGIDKSGTIIIKEKRWVECDGLKTYC